MTLTQSWVGYLDRSYEQIKRSCLQRLSVIAPEISDHSESNILIIILSFFSGIAEMINLYIDSAAKEVYLGTALRYSSAVKLVKLIDYNIRARNAASVNLLFYLVDSSNNAYTLTTGTVTIPIGTIINSQNGSIPFILQQDVIIKTGYQNAYGNALQYVQINGDILGNTDGSINQKITLPDNYVDGSAEVVIGVDSWAQFRSFGFMFPATKGYIVNIDENQQAFLEFGDGINGVIPNSALTIYANYKTSSGTSGNIPPYQITELQPTIITPIGVYLKVTNPDYASAGTDFEILADIQNRAPRSIRTLDRAVTYQDYVDLCYLVLGVGAAEVGYCCGKFVDVYIAPSSPGAATLALLQSVRDFLANKIMITTRVTVKPSGVSKLYITATVYGKPLELATNVYNEVLQILDNNFGYSQLKINRKVSIPKMISLLEQGTRVDNVEIQKVQILPYAVPLVDGTVPINITFPTLPTGTLKTEYTIQYIGLDGGGNQKFVIYKGTFNQGVFLAGATYTDSQLSLVIATGTYNFGDKWEFTAYPSYPEIFPAAIINITDFSAAIVEVGPIPTDSTARTIYSAITIISQNSSTSCLPPC